MSVHWKPLPEGYKVPETDHNDEIFIKDIEKRPGTGKNICPHCGHRIRGIIDNHIKGPHHNRKKNPNENYK